MVTLNSWFIILAFLLGTYAMLSVYLMQARRRDYGAAPSAVQQSLVLLRRIVLVVIFLAVALFIGMLIRTASNT